PLDARFSTQSVRVSASRLFELKLRFTDPLYQKCSVRCWRHSVGEPIEKPEAEPFFNLRKCFGNGRLSAIEFTGSTGKASVAMDAADRAQLPQTWQGVHIRKSHMSTGLSAQVQEASCGIILSRTRRYLPIVSVERKEAAPEGVNPDSREIHVNSSPFHDRNARSELG